VPQRNELLEFFPVPINFFTISPDITKQSLDVILSEMKTKCKDKKAADNVISFCKTNDINTYQSSDDIYKNKKFEFLVDEIFDCAYTYCDNTNIDVENFEITMMWYNVYSKNGENGEHFHPNSFLSGIFVLQDDEVDKNLKLNTPVPGRTIFMNPIMQNFVIQPTTKNPGSKYYTTNVIPCLTSGTLILFPSWLKHAVSKHPGENYRVTIAFNLMLRGKAGKKSLLNYIEY